MVQPTLVVDTCASPELVPLLALESILAAIIVWRTARHIYWRSHGRRITFHLVLLIACALRWFSWYSLCASSLLVIFTPFLWWSHSFLLLCVAGIIFQWSTAVSAGHASARDVQRTKQISFHHPLVFLHTVHVLVSAGGSIHALTNTLTTTDKIYLFLSLQDPFMYVFRILNMITALVDGLVATFIAVQLWRRLVDAAMSDEMKRKSLVQMFLLVTPLCLSLLLYFVMDASVAFVGFDRTFGHDINIFAFSVLQYFIPSTLISYIFLYVMRRVEAKHVTRLVVMQDQSLVEFEECSSPCAWCTQYQRNPGECNAFFHLDCAEAQGMRYPSQPRPKNDGSPHTIDSSSHSSPYNRDRAHTPHGSIPMLAQERYPLTAAADERQRYLLSQAARNNESFTSRITFFR